MTHERVQKILSNKKILSRRKAEEYMKKGWITVNGKVAKLGDKADPYFDKIELNEEAESDKKGSTLIAFHKPRGVWSNLPQNNEPQITDLLPKKYSKLHTIGRLDKDSEGLILLTDDGVIANKYLNSKSIHKRVYMVTTHDYVEDEDIEKLKKGVVILDDYKTKPCIIKRLKGHKILIELTEGKNRQIRRMFEAIDTHVKHLRRTRFGDISIGDLGKGKYREIK
jgi:pseudouridine synthase